MAGHAVGLDALFLLQRVFGLDPITVTPFESIDLVETLLLQEERRTGAGTFVRSGSVEHDSHVLGIELGPFVDIEGVFIDGLWDFVFTLVPLGFGPDIDNQEVVVLELGFKFLNRHEFSLVSGVSLIE